MYGGKCLKQIDDLLSKLANCYQWSICPWGAGGRFSSFAFISKEKKLLDKFINCSSNYVDICLSLDSTFSYGSFADIPQCNMFISSYKVIDLFSEVTKAIIFDETDEPKIEQPGSYIWNICECEFSQPWLVTHSPYDETYSEFTSPFLAEDIDFKFIQEIKFIIEEKFFAYSQVWSLGIYQPINKDSFISMCRVYRCDPDTLVTVSQEADLEKLKKAIYEN